MQRRNFLNRLPFIASIPVLHSAGLSSALEDYNNVLVELQAHDPKDEAYWLTVRKAFNMSENEIDLNSAGLGAANLEVFNALTESLQKFNKLPSRQINVLRRTLEHVKSELAGMVNCQPEELALCRNATEALATAIFGLPLKSGDEVIVGKYDYPHIYYAWKQREQRDGIVLHYVDPGSCPKKPKDIIKAYLKAVSNNTKAIQLTQLINYNGCRVPCDKIIAGLPDNVRYKLVDVAQSFANTQNELTSMNATHIGTSLHKWLSAPVGTGFLYVKSEFIQETWPLFASISHTENIISKFEHMGTMNLASFASISLAVEFHNAIGAKRKQKRLIELGDYFIEKSKAVNGLKIVSPTHKKLKSNLVLFQIANMDQVDVAQALWKDYKIHVTQSNWFDVRGVRISPNIFTRKQDLDQLINALDAIAANSK